jgi:ATP-dependent Clp endopeptidase proteolytic subunit ClpP
MKKILNPVSHNQVIMQPVDAVVEEIKFKSAMRKRRLCFNTEVDEDEVFKCAYFINKLVELDAISGTKEPITIAIASPGGSVYAGLELVSLIEQLKDEGYEVITEVTSIAASMAFLFAIVGSKGMRKAYRHASFMFHQVSAGTWGTLQEMQEDIIETTRLWEIGKDLVIKNTNITSEQLEKMKAEKRNWWMSPKEAVELGVCDIIL